MPIGQITVGSRRRHKLGNLRKLQASIERHGLFHPILVRNGRELVAGARRLEACRQLGYEKIDVRDVTDCDDAALRAIELEENDARLDLETIDRTRARLAQLRAEEAAVAAISGRDVPKKPRGRHDRPTGERRGRPRRHTNDAKKKERERLEEHEALVERFPFLASEGNGWVKTNALRAGKLLAELPPAEYPAVNRMFDQPGVPASKVLQMLGNLTVWSFATRDIVYRATPEDALSLALVEAPQPDPAAIWLGDMLRAGRKAVQFCALPAFVPALQQEIRHLEELQRAFSRHQQDRITAWREQVKRDVGQKGNGSWAQ
jgi:hypothetical protein